MKKDILMILAGDTGGTNTRLALFDDDGNPAGEPAVTPNAGRTSFEEIVREFLDKIGPARGSIERACFGVAGPVTGGRVTLTNLHWQLDAEALETSLGVAQVALINDLVANAEGVERLEEKHLVALNCGTEAEGGARAVIAAGTGLGEAAMIYDASRDGYRAVASEGGHCDFSPGDDREVALLKFIYSRADHASWESVLSGPGLRTIYDFLVSPGQLGPSAALSSADPTPAEISDAGLADRNPAAAAALEMFVGLYGAEAGNLALKLLATGGVYVGGGIAPKLLPLLRGPAFLERFRRKGPEKLRDVLRRIPVYVINFDLCALYGAANYASRL